LGGNGGKKDTKNRGLCVTDAVTVIDADEDRTGFGLGNLLANAIAILKLYLSISQ